ncbi:MAG: hypothetical protein H0V01_00745 [Bacteroidetes bacterium]|nr:hypothetical protein [Bacteroidota bacterium]HET6243407.1 hypothetical protein [Bacteroidia bacterium]
MKNNNKKSPRTATKNQGKERPLIKEDLKNTGKGTISSKGGFKSANDLKGHSVKKK